MDTLGNFALIGLLGAIYFFPAIVAWVRSRQAMTVFVVNFFFGWTLVGWVIALAMAVSERKAPTVA